MRICSVRSSFFTQNFSIMHEFEDIRKILVIKLRHIGDVLLTVPVFRALRENFPDAHISALVNSGTEEVLSGHPLIDEVITYNRGIKNLHHVQRYIKELSFLKGIRSGGFDMSVDLTSGDRAAILSFLSGARYRFAYDPRGDGFWGKRYLYTHRARKDGSQHMVLQNLDIIKQFGISTEDITVDMAIPKDTRSFVKNVFERNTIKETEAVVHIHPTSRWLFKCWKDEYMAEVIDRLTDRGIRVIVTASPVAKELEKAKRILSMLKGISLPIDLCGSTTIKQLAAIAAAATLFFGVDSAPMHIAAATGTPVIALFGPTGHAQWGPWGAGHTVLTKNMKCMECKRDTCDGVEVRKCLEAITPDEVFDAITRALRLKGIAR